MPRQSKSVTPKPCCQDSRYKPATVMPRGDPRYKRATPMMPREDPRYKRATVNKKPLVKKIGTTCAAKVGTTGNPCPHPRQGDSRWCGKHFNRHHGSGITCAATVGTTGKPCPHPRQGDSRWCGKHFNKHHGSS